MAQLPISTFLTTRLKEFDPTFELRGGTGFEQLFFKPMEFIVQPLRDEANEIYTSQSLLRILLTSDPDAYNEEAVDAIVSNLYVTRRQGGQSSGVARVYFNDPVDREYPAGGAVFTGSNGLTYSNPAPFIITSAEMSSQVDTNGLYYMDIAITSDSTGVSTELEVDNIVSLANDADYVSVTNQLAIKGGLNRETNTELISRTQNSIGVRDLVTGKGFNAILYDNFSDSIAELQPIGFGDDEMMRDIVYNTHIGGRVDGYVKTPALQSGYKDFIGVLIDDTRQTYTSTNTQLIGQLDSLLNSNNIDRSNQKIPIVQEIKSAKAAKYTSPVNMSSPLNLSSNQYVKIGIDGVFRNIRVAGVNPAATTRNEIVNLINAAFGINVAFPVSGSVAIQSLTSGLTSQVVLSSPDSGTSALFPVFGLSDGGSPYTYSGDGPVTYLEGQHYLLNDPEGKIRRVIGPTIVSTKLTGQSNANSNQFLDATSNVFLSVQPKDIITIVTGADAGDYRVVSVTNANTLVLDKKLTATAGSIVYFITRTGIKSGEVVNVQYWFNPLSIDIGKLVKLDQYGANRGIRPGREAMTITDLAMVRIVSIEEIDSITFEPTGRVLVGSSGYGHGGYGQGGYGSGSGSDWQLIVNSPTERFSMFEDSYIVLNSGFSALSFRVNYDYAPEIESYHNFVRSDSERVLDGDILMKHFLPAFVSGTIRYSVNSSDSSVPDNDTLQAGVKNFIEKTKAGKRLTYSDIVQYIVRTTDPFDTYGSDVASFKLEALIHNADGTITYITGNDFLEVVAPDPFPRFTSHPLSPRIVHWIPDQIILERVNAI